MCKLPLQTMLISGRGGWRPEDAGPGFRWVNYHVLYRLMVWFLGKQMQKTNWMHVFACGLVTVPQIHTAASDCLGWGGVGWGAMTTSLALPHDLDATLYDLHWQFHMILMLRSLIFNCHCTHPHPIVWGGVGWGGMITSLALPHDLDATLCDLHWQFHIILMLRSMIFIGNSTWS